VRQPSDYSIEAAEVLRSLGGTPVVIGALAALRYRTDSRLTTDADLLVQPVADIRRAFEERGFTVTEMREPGGEPYAYFVRGNSERIDILIAETGYQREALARSTDGYLTVEDVIVHKLLAWRPRDVDDVRSILAGDPHLDIGYVERWAREWEVLDRWEEAKTWASR
jgi:hypothetical protein